jgi:hypothetical protein
MNRLVANHWVVDLSLPDKSTDPSLKSASEDNDEEKLYRSGGNVEVIQASGDDEEYENRKRGEGGSDQSDPSGGRSRKGGEAWDIEPLEKWVGRVEENHAHADAEEGGEEEVD